MKKITITAVLLLFATLLPLHGQLLIKEASLEKQITNSSLVVEGKVVSKQSFWDVNYSNIYTVNTIEIYKVFKGEPAVTIDVITAGGTIGLEAEIVTPSLELRPNELGVFMLYDNHVELEADGRSLAKRFKAYGSVQGFYKYNLHTNVAVNPFNKKQGITTSFYNEIMSYTRTNFVEMKKINASQQKVSLPPTSITFTPSTVTGGTQTVLTINGSGFGGNQGKVGFSNADDGGATFIDALDTQVLTWSDTQITVEVPSRAGTGTIRVTDSGSASDVSAADLTVTYSETNLISDDLSSGTDVAYNTRLVEDNGSGGYTWRMFTDFNANSAANTSFLRALETWRCETNVNWVMGSTTTVDVAARDGINVVRFDNGNELGTDVLGRCVSYYSGCTAGGNTTINWFVNELDISFDDATDWNFGTGLPDITEFDFESVALHELGHGHQLGHVINTNDDVMHYALSNAEDQRVLSANNMTAAGNVHSRSTGGAVCSASVMTNYSGNCGLSVDEEELNKSISLYPNPSQGTFYIENKSFINLTEATIYDLGGRLISRYDLSNTSETKTIHTVGASKGVYFVNIHSEDAVITRKMVLD